MSGIWAVFGSRESVSVHCNAVHKISHRGPDAFRIESINGFKTVCLGFQRLAIKDGVRGMQPMRLFSHPHVWLIYNGEIYNYRLLQKDLDHEFSTDCDGEPIIHLYAREGAEFTATRLDGVFAFCLFDTAKRKVYLGRDTFGVKPLFKLYTENGFLAVCSEAKGLVGLTHSLTKEQAMIEPFPPGHIEEYDIDLEGRAVFRERKRFHEIGKEAAYNTLAPPIGDDVKTNIRNLFDSAVKKRLMADRRIGCLLSGGLDSSLVAALLVKNAKEQNLQYPIQTFSVGLEGSPDLTAARKVAKHLGTEHHELVLTPDDGLPVIESAVYHTETYDVISLRFAWANYLLAKYIHDNTDTVVILSGDGSDELTQGYIYFHKTLTASDGDAESRRLLEDIYLYGALRADRTIAAWGLELRVPFLDHQFSGYYLSLPADQRLPYKGIEKYLLRSAFDGTGLLPEDILWRPKEGFSDDLSSRAKSWNEVIEEFCEDQINKEELQQAPKSYPFNTPTTKEGLFYRKIFEKYFPGQSQMIPYFWMPKWITVSDPSARVIEHYK